MSTIPHAIQPSHEGPFPQPSPQRSVKDVLITPCKGCHETEHTPACARLLSPTNSASVRPLIGARSRLFGFFHNFGKRRRGLSAFVAHGSRSVEICHSLKLKGLV